MIKILEVKAYINDCYYTSSIADKLKMAGLGIREIRKERPGHVIGVCYSPNLSNLARILGVDSVQVIKSTPCKPKWRDDERVKTNA